MDGKISGRVWVFGDNVDTDQIIPAEYLVMADPMELGRHAFEKARPDFAGRMREGDIIIAGWNFGCGSSREHAPMALIGCGVKCVIAKSFARIFYRNSINIGLPLVECAVEAREGDEVEVDFKSGKARNIITGGEFGFKAPPGFLMELMKSGGLIEYTKRKLKGRG